MEGADQHRDFWAEADSAGRGFGRRRERGVREAYRDTGAWARRGATALRDRYRDVTDWRWRYQDGRYEDRQSGGRGQGAPGWDSGRAPGWDSGRPRGLVGALPFLARFGGNGGSGGWDGPGRARGKGDWWRRWTWKKALAVAGAGCGVVIVSGSIAVGVAYANTNIPSMRQLVNQSSVASTVYFSNGKPVATFGQTTHVVLNYNQIPQVMRDAMVAAEDKNFYNEGGVSISGIIRAAYYDLTSSSGNLQGASTITEQLVKQAYEGVSTQATNGGNLSVGLSNKLKEILIAEKLAKQKSKEWILTEYLNSVYFGAPSPGSQGAVGVGAAAEDFFGVPASKLDAAQAAVLASMVQQPSFYSPDPKAGAGYTALMQRWRTHTLATMAQMGTLSAKQAATLKFPKISPQVNGNWGGYRGYIMQRVAYELQTEYFHTATLQEAIDKASVAGLKIYTTYSQRLMDGLYTTVAGEQRLMKHCAPPQTATVGGGNAMGLGYACTRLPRWVNTGAVLIQPSTGGILAEYGGKDYNKNKYDMAMESYNQVGSSFKPYVLAAAIKQGMNAMTSVMNGFSPLWIPPVGSPPTVYPKQGPVATAPPGTTGWFPVVNDDNPASVGPVSAQRAMAASLNTAFTSLYSRVGGQAVMQTAQQFGVYTGQGTGLATNQNEVGEALGQGSLTVLEQATMIATIANNGTYIEPHAIVKIVNGSRTFRPPVPRHQVLTEPQAAEMDWAMSRDLYPGGTAPGDNLPNGQVAIAKTGTTNLAQSAFFIGATPSYAMAVGMFVQHPGCTLPKSLQYECTSQASLSYAPPKSLETLFGVGGLAGYGGGWPATTWHDFFVKEFSSVPVQAWPAPPANLGVKWNLVGPLPKPKPKPKRTPRPRPSPPCFGHWKKCPSPGPTPTQTCPPGFPCPTPDPTSTTQSPPPGGLPSRAAGAGGPGPGTAVAGTMLVGGVAVLAVPVRRRKRRRRRG